MTENVQLTMMGSVSELADFIGEPITETVDVKRATMTLRFASMLVLDETQQSYASELEVPEKVLLITLACASRGYLNPESWGNERLDDWGAGGRPVEELGMYLTGTEKRALASFRPARPRLGTVSTFRGDLPGSLDGFVPTAPPGVPQTPIPWW